MEMKPFGWFFVPKMRNMTTIDVEEKPIVLCRDCKYGEPCIPPCEDLYCVFYDQRHNSNFFCADGEKEGEEQ